jgi:hypothetical protein
MGRPAKASGLDHLPDHAAPPTAPGGEPLVADMLNRLTQQRLASGAEALRLLRDEYPNSPLALRVMALNMLLQSAPSQIQKYSE